ncbi:MAG: hypothetical protein ACKOTB_05170 [Planctomycetia bacterium]
MYSPHDESTRHTTAARAASPETASFRFGIRRKKSSSATTRLLWTVLLAATLASGLVPGLPSGSATAVAASPTFEVKFRVKGIVSTQTVQARDAGQAKKLVMAQYAGEATVLSVKRLR